MQIIAEELVKQGVSTENIIFINLDKKPYKSIKKTTDLEKKIDTLFDGVSGLKYLFIDEIQNVKGFEETINAYREEGDFSIFITGSNSYLLSVELATKLTGRYLEFNMTTLSFYEYLEISSLIGRLI